SIHDYLEFKDVGELKTGDLLVNGQMRGYLDDFKIDSHIVVKNFTTSFVNGEKLDVNLSLNNEQIKFENAKLFTSEGYLNLLSPFEFFNFKSMKFVEDPIVAQIENINLNNA